MKLLKSPLKLAGQWAVETMGDEKLAERADAQKVEGKGSVEDREWMEDPRQERSGETGKRE